jgi:SAM-dependent methyltransferase
MVIPSEPDTRDGSAASANDPETGIDYERLYEFRFRDVPQQSRQAVWDEIAPVVYRWLGQPERVLDPAAGRGEFIRAIPARERWAVDWVDHTEGLDASVTFVVGDARTVDLPAEHFDGVFVSNLLEHFTSQDDIGTFLRKLRRAMAPGGRIAVMGPNFRYCPREYFDCADHTLALTDGSVEEHLYAAGFEIERVVPRFLPYSFRGRHPQSPWVVRRYLAMPFAWRFFGRQFLVVASRPSPSA